MPFLQDESPERATCQIASSFRAKHQHPACWLLWLHTQVNAWGPTMGCEALRIAYTVVSQNPIDLTLTQSMEDASVKVINGTQEATPVRSERRPLPSLGLNQDVSAISIPFSCLLLSHPYGVCYARRCLMCGVSSLPRVGFKVVPEGWTFPRIPMTSVPCTTLQQDQTALSDGGRPPRSKEPYLNRE